MQKVIQKFSIWLFRRAFGLTDNLYKRKKKGGK